MNPARLRAIENSQTSIAKKVLSCVPIQEAWTQHQIKMELHRSGSRTDPRIIEGCLNTLLESGLIKEPTRGSFQRIHIPDVQKDEPAVAQPQPEKKPVDPLSRLATVAETLRELADDLEDIALEVTQTRSSNDEELEKLRTLKTLLKQL